MNLKQYDCIIFCSRWEDVLLTEVSIDFYRDNHYNINMKESEQDLLFFDERQFFQIQNLMFCNNKLKYDEKLAQVKGEIEKISPLVDKYCKPFKEKGSNTPPWEHRRMVEIIRINLDPVLSRAVFVANNCSQSSVVAYSEEVRRYCWQTNTISAEMREYLWSKIILGNNTYHVYREPLIFFDKDMNQIGPKNDPQVLDRTHSLHNAHEQCMFIRIGRYAEKADLEWFIDRYWDEITEHMPMANTRKWRVKASYIISLLTRCLIQCGIENDDIIGMLNDRSNIALAYSNINQERFKLKNELNEDCFDLAYQQLIESTNSERITLHSHRLAEECNLHLSFDISTQRFQVSTKKGKKKPLHVESIESKN